MTSLSALHGSLLGSPSSSSISMTLEEGETTTTLESVVLEMLTLNDSTSSALESCVVVIVKH